MRVSRWAIAALIVLAVVSVSAAGLGQYRQSRAAIEADAIAMTGGNPRTGRELIERFGCGSCHTIPGIRGADALVGPPLNRIGARVYIAGVLTNTPGHLVSWLEDPPSVDPKTAMPNLHLTQAQARDVACYLYTLR